MTRRFDSTSWTQADQVGNNTGGCDVQLFKMVSIERLCGPKAAINGHNIVCSLHNRLSTETVWRRCWDSVQYGRLLGQEHGEVDYSTSEWVKTGGLVFIGEVQSQQRDFLGCESGIVDLHCRNVWEIVRLSGLRLY